MINSEFKLTQIEVSSGVWVKIKEYLEDRLQVLRETNDNPLDELATARIRGKIEFCKHILNAGISDNQFRD